MDLSTFVIWMEAKWGKVGFLAHTHLWGVLELQFRPSIGSKVGYLHWKEWCRVNYINFVIKLNFTIPIIPGFQYNVICVMICLKGKKHIIFIYCMEVNYIKTYVQFYYLVQLISNYNNSKIN